MLHERHSVRQPRVTGNARRLTQVVLVLSATAVAAYIVADRDDPTSPNVGFDMLGYLDSRVAAQEDEKDVRCWSSFCKLQMFVAGAPIDEDAVAARIEEHRQLIESIWQQASREHVDGPVISAAAVKDVLRRRFPHVDDDVQGTTFVLEGITGPIQIGSEELTDYSDTIEPWRLLQAWASSHTDDAGRLALSPSLDEEALVALYNFLKVYDLAILKHARTIAREHKLAVVDEPTMVAAFDLESRLVRSPKPPRYGPETDSGSLQD